MNKKTYLLLGIILLLMAFLRMRFSDIAMERDEGMYTYIGHLILNGKTPYVDFYETRFPGIFYMYALLVAVFGYSIKGIALGILCLNLASAYFVFDIGRRLFSSTAGLLAAAAFTFLSLAPDISGFTRQSEHMVNFWALAGTSILVRALEDRKFWKLILSGASMCMAMLVKPNAVYLIPAVGLIPLLFDLGQNPKNWLNGIKSGLWYSLGALALFGLMCLYIYAQGAWPQFYEFAFIEAGKYADAVKWEEGKLYLNGTWKFLLERYSALVYLSLLGLGAIWLAPVKWPVKATILLLFLAGFATITPGLRFLGHYWLMWMPAMALAFGAGAYGLESFLSKKMQGGSLPLLAPGLFGLVLLIHFFANRDYYLSPDFNKILEKTYSVNPFAEVKKLGDFLAKRVKPGDKVALVGSEPQVFVYTGAESPTKHAYFTYLMLDTLKTPQAKVWQKEFISDIEREKPRFIFFTGHAVSICANNNSDVRFFDWFFPYVNNNYQRIACADLISDTQTKYVMDAGALKTFKPESKFYVDVYERK